MEDEFQGTSYHSERVFERLNDTAGFHVSNRERRLVTLCFQLLQKSSRDLALVITAVYKPKS